MFQLLTFRSNRFVGPTITAEVNDDVSDAVNIPDIAIPTVIQNIAKSLAKNDLGVISP